MLEKCKTAEEATNLSKACQDLLFKVGRSVEQSLTLSLSERISEEFAVVPARIQ
jgi:hypothetical protein